MLGGLFDRQHYVTISDRRRVFGEFNALLSGKVLVFLDEATWGGDKRDAGVIKSYITADRVQIHRKFQSEVDERSMLHWALASNEDWPVGLDRDDRRFCVLKVGTSCANDLAYFKALHAELDGGGRAAMLHELLARTVNRDALRHAPLTDAKLALKHESMSALDNWWFEKLKDGRLLPANKDWTGEVSRDDLVQDYMTEMDRHRTSSKRAWATQVGAFLAKVVPGLTTRRDKARQRVWVFPTLDDCRAAWDGHMKQAHDWDDGDGTPLKVRRVA
jgi:hypothetical protein